MDEQEATGRRRWFRFSLRDLFWVTLLVAVLIAWRLDHTKTSWERDAAVYRLHKASEKGVDNLIFGTPLSDGGEVPADLLKK